MSWFGAREGVDDLLGVAGLGCGEPFSCFGDLKGLVCGGEKSGWEGYELLRYEVFAWEERCDVCCVGFVEAGVGGDPGDGFV